LPELPDIEVYAECLTAKFGGQPLEALRIKSPFLLRSTGVEPSALHRRVLRGVTRLGKRLVFEFTDEHFAILHLMIAGRLQLKQPGAAIVGKIGLAAFDFSSASLQLTEASSHKRASLHLVRGKRSVDEFDRGGLEPLESELSTFAKRLREENRTLKRILTDPRLFSGIGNAYSDEILHRARLSPVKRTSNLSDEEIMMLHAATQEVLTEWTRRLRGSTEDGFPTKVTAFRPEMAVHGRYGKPCPVCQGKVARIRYAKNEVNYCPRCQTDGRLLADRALSRLLKADWPRSLEELEEMKVSGKQ
jgi:formamidopyrimidine-DNA glycosylase